MLSDERRSEITFSNIDTSDCGVVAIQAVTGLPRREAEELALSYGYKPGQGTPRGNLDQAVRSLGYRLRSVDVDPGETAASFAVVNEYGTFLVYVAGHVMGLVDGNLLNSRGQWRQPVEDVMEVLPPNNRKDIS